LASSWVPARVGEAPAVAGHCGSGWAATTVAFIGTRTLDSRNLPPESQLVRV